MNLRIPEQNQVIITGRLTRDPQTAYTQKGSAVCYFDIAVNRRYKDTVSQEWKDDVTYVPVTAWGPIADRCKEKLKKGSPVHVEGRLASSEYTDKKGEKRKSLKIVAKRVQFLAAASKEESAPDAQSSEGVEESSEKASESGIDEVPF